MTPVKISLLLPTRGRPERLKNFLDSAYQLAKYPDRIQVVLYIDADDLTTLHFEYQHLYTKKIIGERSTMGFYNTKCLKASDGEIIILANDDVVIQTKNWDEKISEFHDSHPDKIYLAYPNDLNKKKSLATFPILSRKTCDLLRDIFPAEYKGSLIDLHLYDIFNRFKKKKSERLFFLEDVVFEHRHFRNNKAEIDDTYKNRSRFGDDEVFVSLVNLRQNEFKRLQKIGDEQEVIAQEAPVKGLLKKITRYAVKFGFDFGAPLGWRVYLFYYFSARSVYERFFL